MLKSNYPFINSLTSTMSIEHTLPMVVIYLLSTRAVFLKWGYVYPWGYSEVLQGVLERKWNIEKKYFIVVE